MPERHDPTEEQRRTVRAMVAFGIPREQVAAVVGISQPTLRLHYQVELDTALAEANAKVAQGLFTMATKGGSVAAAIFWLKTRAGWRETSVVEHAGADGGPVRVVYSWADPQPGTPEEQAGAPAADRSGFGEPSDGSG